MKNKYTIAYIGAVIAIPVALLFIVPAVATTSANVFGGDMQTLFTDAQNQALSSFGNTDSDVLPVPGTLLNLGESTDNNVLPVPTMIYTLSSNEVSGTGVSAGASSGSTGSAGSATTGTGGSAWASNSGYANANVSVNLGCTDCEEICTDPVPSCTFDALPSTIHAGESVTLTWDTTNATAVSIDGIGAVSIDGSKVVTPTASRSYTLNATSNGGAAKCVKTVQVVPVTVPVPSCTFDALPSTIHAGESVTLTWDTTNATAVSIDGIGAVSIDGSKVVTPTASRSYTLNATSNGGVAQCVKTVQVVPVVVTHPAPTCTFSINPESIKVGSSATFTWDTTNATAVSIASIGAVTVDGTKVVYPTQSRSYELTATGEGGMVKCIDTIVVTPEDVVHTTSTTTYTNVNNNYNNFSNYNSYNNYSSYSSGHSSRNNNARCDSFTVSDSSVDEGDEVTLRWKTSNADDVDINQGVGDVDDDGSEKVTIDEDTTFTLTARDGSSKDTCKVTVRTNGSTSHHNDNEDLRCVFSVSDNSIYSGQDTILSWNNDGTDRLMLKDSFGKTLADSKKNSGVDEDMDTLTVSPTKSTKYTLDVYKGNKKKTCTLDVEVSKGMVQGISLSQVPYTGFDAGPMLTAIFYGAIVLWGLVLAYILVLKKKSAQRLSK